MTTLTNEQRLNIIHPHLHFYQVDDSVGRLVSDVYVSSLHPDLKPRSKVLIKSTADGASTLMMASIVREVPVQTAIKTNIHPIISLLDDEQFKVYSIQRVGLTEAIADHSLAKLAEETRAEYAHAIQSLTGESNVPSV